MSLVNISAESLQELQAFVFHEARLLDEARYAEWNALFTPEGRYWLPVSREARDPLLEASHLYDDQMLREVHLARLQSPHAHSQQPRGRCHHLLQQPEVLEHDTAAGVFVLRTPFIYHELRAGHTVSLPGVATHRLVRSFEGLRIALKRVDLLHAGEPLPAVEFYI